MLALPSSTAAMLASDTTLTMGMSAVGGLTTSVREDFRLSGFASSSSWVRFGGTGHGLLVRYLAGDVVSDERLVHEVFVGGVNLELGDVLMVVSQSYRQPILPKNWMRVSRMSLRFTSSIRCFAFLKDS